VNAIAHSLGARVVLSSLPYLLPGDLGRVVLLAGAEFRDRAAHVVDSPAGRAVEIVNVASSENALFDGLLRLLLRPLSLDAVAIGRGLPASRPNWIDLYIDDPGTRSGLARLGIRLPAPARRICHWSGYMRPGMFMLHRRLLRSPGALTFAELRAVLPVGTTDPARGLAVWQLAVAPGRSRPIA
jgi:hypothetical protein